MNCNLVVKLSVEHTNIHYLLYLDYLQSTVPLWVVIKFDFTILIAMHFYVIIIAAILFIATSALD